jgi:nucleolar protein 14
MPPSQLKRLKASLREQGLTGPPKSKKQKKAGLSTEAKIKRNAALASIRETFNPFEVKHQSRPSKHDITTAKTMNGKVSRVALGRPGVTKSLNEERRRQTLLVDLQNRNKAGGIVDNRIGEDDPLMTEEEKALKRFARERKRKGKVFDLEGGDEDEEMLTHGGRAIDFDNVDDFDEGSLDEESDEDDERMARKRRLAELLGEQANGEDEENQRKKSRTEIMEEVMKKSKLFKYERQAAKEEDYDARHELDKELPDIREALGAFAMAIERKNQAPVKPVGKVPVIHPDRMNLMNGTAEPKKDDYDIDLKKLATDGRAKPADRTKTEEEIEEEEANRLKELEESRMKRMMGLEDEDDEEPPQDRKHKSQDEDFFPNGDNDDAAKFGFKGSNFVHTRPDGVDDEDDFLIEDNLVASDDESVDEAEIDEEDLESDSSDDDLLLGDDAPKVNGNGTHKIKRDTDSSCPRTLGEITEHFSKVPFESYHESIRQIRLKNDPSLSEKNRENTALFAQSLVEYLATLPIMDPPPPSSTLDAVIRHIHSMARKIPEVVGEAFREHLKTMHMSESIHIDAGNIVMLTAIGTVFSASDHFHLVVTPALLLITRWLALTIESGNDLTRADLAKGAYLVRLTLKYQELAKRFVPEAVRFTLHALSTVSPPKLAEPHLKNLDLMTDLWSHHSALSSVFPNPLIASLLTRNKAPQQLSTRITHRLSNADSSLNTLLLHSHKPLPIRTYVPRFEEDFSASKHYDPDPIRAERARLRKEFKREKKSTIREVRKDAQFLAREGLREKKERDRRYEEKYRKLVAEIQSGEGKESREYDGEKRKRQMARKKARQ